MRRAPIALLLATLASAATVNANADATPSAQHTHWRHHDGEGRLQRMLDTVGATDAQRTQITAIAASYKPQLKDLHHQLRANRRSFQDLDPMTSSYSNQAFALADQRGQIVANVAKTRAQMRQEIAGVLTDAQRATLRQALENRRQRAHEQG